MAPRPGRTSGQRAIGARAARAIAIPGALMNQLRALRLALQERRQESIGSGNTMVVFLSAPMTVSVSR